MTASARQMICMPLARRGGLPNMRNATFCKHAPPGTLVSRLHGRKRVLPGPAQSHPVRKHAAQRDTHVNHTELASCDNHAFAERKRHV